MSVNKNKINIKNKVDTEKRVELEKLELSERLLAASVDKTTNNYEIADTWTKVLQQKKKEATELNWGEKNLEQQADCLRPFM